MEIQKLSRTDKSRRWFYGELIIDENTYSPDRPRHTKIRIYLGKKGYWIGIAHKTGMEDEKSEYIVSKCKTIPEIVQIIGLTEPPEGTVDAFQNMQKKIIQRLEEVAGGKNEQSKSS